VTPAISVAGLSRRYRGQLALDQVTFDIEPGSITGLLGRNGAGKTTLLRMLAGVEKPDTGEVNPGHGLRLGYYAQEHETLDTERSLIENMRTASPELTDTEMRKVLGSFLFSGDDVDKPVGVLSGGENGRLDPALKIRGTSHKHILKRVAERYLPREIVHRGKQGFVMPLTEWLAGALRGELDDHLGATGLARRGLFRDGVLARLLDEHRRGRHNHAGRLWALLILERWFRRYAPNWSMA